MLLEPSAPPPLSSQPSGTAVPAAQERRALCWLLFLCVLWGPSFTWVKDGVVQVSNLVEHSEKTLVGPAVFYAHRFLLSAVAWALFFPRSLRGWSVQNFLTGGVLTGGALTLGNAFQLYSIRDTSASLSAFLTSLTVVYTPIMSFLLFRERVPRQVWGAILTAVVGVMLMTSFRPEGGIDQGAVLGFLCAVVFSLYYILIGRYGSTEGMWRFTLQQFLCCGVAFTVGAFLMGEGEVAGVLLRYPRETWVLQLLCVLVATVAAFGIMLRFQPETTPTKAALVYTTEPIFATAYAWGVAGAALSVEASVGAGIILLANCYTVLRTGAPVTVTETVTESTEGSPA